MIFSKILVALAPYPQAPAVLRIATEIADRFDSQLYLFRAIAIEPVFPPAASTASIHDNLPEYLRREALTELSSLADGNPRALARPPIVRQGAPAPTMLDVVSEIHADLLVVGSHGFHGLDYLLGTTTGTVATRARCNVLVVHDAS